MNFEEYAAKALILTAAGIPVPHGILADTLPRLRWRPRISAVA